MKQKYKPAPVSFCVVQKMNRCWDTENIMGALHIKNVQDNVIRNYGIRKI